MTIQYVQLPFTPRKWQIPLLENDAPSIVAVVHRRAGKSTALIWRELRKAATHDRRHIPISRRNRSDPPRCVHVLPLQVTWKKTGLWDKVERAASSIPGARVMKSEFRVVLPNGGVYQCGGMDKPDNWRGGYADEVVEDEADDVIADGLDMVIEPMLADYSGTRIKIGTPKGNGRLAKAYNDAAPEARFLLPWQQTGVLDDQQISDLRNKLDVEEFAQEMECSFTSPNAGSYYGKWLDAAIREDRICRVLYDPKIPVYTSWDLGMHDATSIWFFQISPRGEWRWLEYFEDSSRGLDEYAKLLASKQYVYKRHLLPHDVEVRELTYQGRSRREYLKENGVSPIQTVPACNPADRVAAVRTILPKSYFDAKGCEIGLATLRAYRRSWNEHMGIWRSEPVHDAASHCADAFGTGVQGASDPQEEKPGLVIPPPRVVLAPPHHGAWLNR
jgi:phage terminase large subunit